MNHYINNNINVEITYIHKIMNSSTDLNNKQMPNNTNLRHAVLPPPPKLLLPKITNHTSLLSCLHHVRSHHNAITIAFCDIPLLSATITECLSNIKHLEHSYSEKHNKWQFKYGSVPKFSHRMLSSRRQMEFKQATLFYAALEAFDKFPHHFDAEDYDRRDQYRFVVDRHGGEDLTPPYCSGVVSLYYNIYNNTIILEIHKGEEIDSVNTYLTTNLIRQSIFDALHTAGFDASPFDNDEFKKDIEEKKHMWVMEFVQLREIKGI